MRRLLALAAIILTLVGALGAWRALEQERAIAAAFDLRSGTGAPEPRVDGNRLIDARTQQAWVPRGVNWSSFEYACAQGWGYSALDQVIGDDPAAQVARAIADFGANTVRLPLNQDCWLGSRGAPVDDYVHDRSAGEYREHVRDFVAALHRAGIVVVLDLQSRKRIGENEFGNVAMPDGESLLFWRSVAQEYGRDPSVMFDAFNEPYSRYDATTGDWTFELSWECWRDGGCTPPLDDDKTPTTGQPSYPAVGMAAVVAVIRDADAEQPILLSGLDYAGDLTHWLEFAPSDDQLVAAFHNYDFKPCNTRGCWDDTLATLAEQVPVITSELGAEDPTGPYVGDYLAWADDHGIGALAWVWDHGPTDPMSLVRSGGNEPATSYGAGVRAWLLGHRVG